MLPVNHQNISTNKNTIVSIGNFDGVHLGHQAILNTLIIQAKKLNLKPIIITFEPHPNFFLNPKSNFSLICQPKLKQQLLNQYNVKVIYISFEKSFSQLTSHEFIEKVLIKKLNTKALIQGHSHRFGKQGTGNINLLKKIFKKENVFEIPSLTLNHQAINSTLIRKLITKGDLQTTQQYLSRPFQFEGVIIKGDGRGRKLGFPTANIQTDTQIIQPAQGVYQAHITVEKQEFLAIVNIGTRPTFKNDEIIHIEAHILNFNQNIYGKTVNLKLYLCIREQKKFESSKQLQDQIIKDIKNFNSFKTNPN